MASQSPGTDEWSRTCSISNRRSAAATLFPPSLGVRMKAFRWLWLVMTVGLLAYGYYVAMYVVPTEATMGNVQRIFYYHLPSWIVMSLLFGLNLCASIAFLVLRR